MTWLENVQHNLSDFAGKVGLTPDKVKSVSDTIQKKLDAGESQLAALQESAKQHGVSLEKVQELFKHANEPGGVVGKIKGVFKKH